MAKDYRRLWKDITSTSDEGKAVRILAEILVDTEGRTFISNLERKDAELCIEVLDCGMAEHKLNTAEKQAFFIALRRLAVIHERLPDSVMITENIEVSDNILASGGFADVRIGKYMGHLVAVKTMRVAPLDDVSKIRKQFCKEVVLWSTLSHPNVLKLVGIQGDMDKGQFITVSEWMAHGNIMEYTRKHSVNRLELLHGAAQGLKYLHDAGLVHGDLKGANILMSNSIPPRACLADFGFTTMALNPSLSVSCGAELEGGTTMFMSPELLIPKRFGFTESVPTPEADIYAFGFVIYQVLTGDTPFPKLRMADIVLNVVQGVRPPKPANALAIGFSDMLWSFVQSCWDGDMELRPKVARVVSQLGRAAADWVGVMPPSVQTESVSLEPMSDSMAHCGIFESSSDVVSGIPTESQTISMPYGPPSTSSTQCTELPSEVPQKVVTKRFSELQPEPRVPTPPRKEEPCDDIPVAYPHLEQQHESPPSRLPVKRKRGALSRRLSSFLLSMFNRGKRGSSQSLNSDVAQISAESRGQPDQDLVDKVDGMLEDALHDRDQHKLLNILCKMCSRHQIIPKSMHVANCLEGELISEYDGGHTTVFRSEHKGLTVAIKSLRLYQTSDFDKCIKRFIREAVAWRHLRHPNILPLLGMNVDLGEYQLAMISEWMVHGNLNEYAERFEGVNRVQLLTDAANGLEYMHGLNMVHGDLKGANILVNKSLRACLADFGLSTTVGARRRAAAIPFLIPATSKLSLMSFTEGGTTRWMSPELLDPDRFKVLDSRPTKQSDCYALGMVVYEVLCGKVPYWEISNEIAVMRAITDGGRPQKPEAMENLGFTNQLWGLIEQCWLVDASARPDVRAMLSHLSRAAWSWDRRRLE